MLRLLNSAFDLVFQPFQAASPIFPLVFFACVAGGLIGVVFRYTADSQAIRRVKDQVQAQILGVRLFQDQLGVALRCYASILLWTVAYLRQVLVPMAVAIVPILLLFAQLQTRFEWLPAQPGENLVVTARVKDGVPVDGVSLDLPSSLRLTAAPVRVPERREVSWRVRASQYGEFNAYVVAGRPFAKRISVSGGLARLTPLRTNSFLQTLWLAGEPALPAEGPLEAVEVQYRPRELEVGPYRPNWEILLFVLTFVAAFAMKPITGAEF